MNKNIAWIIFATALGIYTNEADGKNPKVCRQRRYNAEGRARSPGWFYDFSIDRCEYLEFGDHLNPDDENRFDTKEECNRLCRRRVPQYCLVELGTSISTSYTSAWTYNSTNGSCYPFMWGGVFGSGINAFRDKQTCERECRDPDMGVCGKPVEPCQPGAGAFYRFNKTTEQCYVDHKTECKNGKKGFATAKKCYKRCGKFVTNKCHLPIQSISYCNILDERYAYNKENDTCEKILGCDDGGNSFETAEKCWTTCAKSSNRCRMKPDKGVFEKFGWGTKRSYYDMRTDKCKPTTQTFYSKGTGSTNLFKDEEECKKVCKRVHKSYPLKD